jgi:hypothetical protein
VFVSIFNFSNLDYNNLIPMDQPNHQQLSNDLANLPAIPMAQLARNMQVGDLIFIRVATKPIHALADVTGAWTNHVGVVIHLDGNDPHIGESTFPFSRTTTFSKFVARSERGRIAVARLKTDLTPQQIEQVQLAAHRRKGVLYDISFNFHSRRQFCSRYAHEIINEATGISVGKVETLKELADQPNVKSWIMQIWFFGCVPWGLKTMTPISLLRSEEMQHVFYGNAIMNRPSLQRTVLQVTEQLLIKSARVLYGAAMFALKKFLGSLQKTT